MKKYVFFLLLILILSACSSHGNLKIYNKTNHYLYFSINDISGTLAAKQSRTISLYTGKQFILNSSSKKYTLYLEGETFLIYDNSLPLTSTKITINGNKTTKIYANPTNACIKIKNNSSTSIYEVSYQKIYPDNISDSVLLTPEILPNETWFKQIPYSCSADSFNIRFSYKNDFQDIIYTQELNLGLDSLFLLEIN